MNAGAMALFNHFVIRLTVLFLCLGHYDQRAASTKSANEHSSVNADNNTPVSAGTMAKLELELTARGFAHLTARTLQLPTSQEA